MNENTENSVVDVVGNNKILLRVPLAEFVKGMEIKMQINEYKGPDYQWRIDGVWALSLRLMEEVGELMEAVRKGKSVKEVEDEAADVANFCMMIADTYKERGNE